MPLLKVQEISKKENIMKNNYEVPEVIEVGNAKDVILGIEKVFQLFDDAPGQPRRDEPMSDDE